MYSMLLVILLVCSKMSICSGLTTTYPTGNDVTYANEIDKKDSSIVNEGIIDKSQMIYKNSDGIQETNGKIESTDNFSWSNEDISEGLGLLNKFVNIFGIKRHLSDNMRSYLRNVMYNAFPKNCRFYTKDFPTYVGIGGEYHVYVNVQCGRKSYDYNFLIKVLDYDNFIISCMKSSDTSCYQCDQGSDELSPLLLKPQ
ncbi:hypothetical protein GJ496_003734 [Pomphorhynchus laevis]|nr:hypothetical protein GJ496_003734 [Pomphorhynchus laevis]